MSKIWAPRSVPAEQTIQGKHATRVREDGLRVVDFLDAQGRLISSYFTADEWRNLIASMPDSPTPVPTPTPTPIPVPSGSPLRTPVKWCRPDGSDSASGSETNPFKTPTRLLAALAPGQTGEMFGGLYTGGWTASDGGAEGKQIQGRMGQVAILRGTADLTGSRVRVVNVKLDLSGITGSAIEVARGGRDAAGVEVICAEIFSNQSNMQGFMVGSSGDHTKAVDLAVRRCIVRHIGAANPGAPRHGLYASQAVGVLIEDSVWYEIHGDPGSRAVQLYPNCDKGVVRHNVFYRCGGGVVFGTDGGSGYSSDDHLIERNIFASILSRAAVARTGSVGAAVVRDNHGFNLSQGKEVGGGMTSSGWTEGDPLFTNPSGGDFSLRAGSPAAGKGPRQRPGLLVA